MHRRVPVVLLNTLENWFSKCYTCVLLCSAWSSFFKIRCMWCKTRWSIVSTTICGVYRRCNKNCSITGERLLHASCLY